MDLNFEIGDPNRPRGHAILYLRVDTEPDSVYAVYVVTLPITADLTKYVPPFLASQLGPAGDNPLASFSAFAMPPMPELVEGGYDHLVRLANLRNDDLLYGGSMFSYDLARMMESVASAVKSYSDAWAQTAPTPAAAPADDLALVGAGAGPGAGLPGIPGADPRSDPGESESDGMGVNEVLWSFMSEADRLGELGRLLGRLRFAQEGADADAITDITAEMTALGRQFPPEFNIASLIAAASDTTNAQGARLAQLHLERCYSLSAGDAAQVRHLDSEINAAGGPP